MTNRNGSTLIEVMLSLTAGSVIMMLAIKLVHQTFQLSTQTSARVDLSHSLNRLARQFRNDVHLASSIQVTSNDSLNTENSDGTKVAYKVKNGLVLRAQTDAAKIETFEQYSLISDSRVAFERAINPERCQLIVENSSSSSGSVPKLHLNVSALVGRWEDSKLLESGEPKRP